MSVHRSKEVYSHIKQLLDIPEDEPIFILRAQDKFSPIILRYYRKVVRDGFRGRLRDFEGWFGEVGNIVDSFIKWQKDNKDKVKVPD